MAAKWEVQSTTTNKVATTTAIYKNDDGKTLATVNGLKGGLKVNNDGTITGIKVTEGTNGVTGTIELSTSVFTTANISLSLSNGGKYDLTFDVNAKPVTPTVTTISASKGTLSLVGNLSEGYKLKDAKNITYAGPKTAVTLAEVKGLDADLAMGTGTNEGKIGVNKTTGEGQEAVTTFTEAITIADGVITLKANALKAGNATLTLKNGADYTLAFDSSVKAPEIDAGTWSEVKNGVSTYTADVSTEGYTLSADGKTVTYYTADGDDVALVTVSGLKSNEGLSFKQNNNEDVVDPKNNRTIVLPAAALNQTTVKITKGAGFLLALDDGVAKSNVAEKDTWKVSGTTATYKHVKPEYYTYDATANQVIYTKEAELKTLATLKGLRSGLTAGDTIVGINVNTTTNVITLSGGADDNGANVDENGALGTSNVTLTNGTDSTYKLALVDTVTTPETSDEEWAVSGTTATLKGYTTAGYAKTNDTTITYVKPSATKLVTLATVKGLAKGVALKDKDSKDAVGINTKEGSETTFTPGLVLNDEGGRTLTVSANVLGTTNATITPAAGYTYEFELDDKSSSAGGKVPTEGDERHFWYVKGKALLLKEGLSRCYNLESDKTTITEIDEKVTTDAATVTGLKTGLKVVDGYIDGIEVSGTTIILSKEVLQQADVKFSGTTNYTFTLNKDVPKPDNGTVWKVSGTTAALRLCKTEGYEGSGTKTITYKSLNPGTYVATLTGLKNGLKVKDDGTIDGIETTAFDFGTNQEKAAKDITLSQNVLGTTDVTLDSTGIDYNYTLKLDPEIEPMVLSKVWKATGNGTVTYTVSPNKAGYVEDNVTDDQTNKLISSKIIYKKKTPVTTTLTGINPDITADDDEIITGISNPDDDGVITLSEDALTDKNVVLKNASGGTYTLALDRAVQAPQVTNWKWTVDKTKAYLKGDIAEGGEGYNLASDNLSVVYTKADTGGTLATVTGIKNGLTADEVDAGITHDNNVLTLTKSVLGGTKLTVTGGTYTLALGESVPIEATAKKGWVTSGTTATLQSYNSEYYTLDAKGTTAKFTKAKTATVHATIKGLKKDADLSGISEDATTVTLTPDMLGTSNVTLTGNGYKLALSNEVPTAEKTELWKGKEEWVTNGTTATFKNYNKAYYTQSSNTTIKYTKATAGTTYATVKGIASGATVTDNNKVITLSANQLAGKKVTLTGSGYSLALGGDVEKAQSQGTYWTQAKNATSAIYKEDFSAGYTLADDGNSIAYSARPTTTTLATVNGIPKNTDALIETRTPDERNLVTGYSYEDSNVFDAVGLSADKETHKITVTDAEKAFGTDPKNAAKLTLKSTEYTFADTNLTAPAADDSTLKLTINKNGKATYTQDVSAGYTLSGEDKVITYSEEKTGNKATVLATVSGLDKNKLKAIIGTESSTAELDLTADTDIKTLKNTYGISILSDKITFENNNVLGKGKVTLGKNDDFSFGLKPAIQPKSGTTNKWAVKGTTATFSKITTDGYTADLKTITYVKEVVGDPIVTITGLKKGLKVSDDGTKVGIASKVDVTDETTGTTTKVTKISNGIIINTGMHEVDLNTDVLGTTNIQLTDNSKAGYKFATIGGKKAADPEKEWSYSGTTATYKEIQTGGYTLEDDKLNVTYTAPKTTTLATVKGLVKNFTGDLSSALNVSGNTITVSKDIVTTGNVTLTLPKNGDPYSLAMGSSILEQTSESTEWVTSGTTATYKKYNTGYYTLDASGSTIVYHKPTAGTTYATIKGIKSGVDINTAVATTKDGGTIELTKDMLGTSKVTVSVPNTNKSAKFELKLAQDVPTTSKKATGWVTSGTKAYYRENYDKGSYALNNGAIVYTKGANEKGTDEIATITGANGDITTKFGTGDDANNFILVGSNLTNKVTVASKAADGVSDHGFKFNNTYNNGAITASANADTIIAEGDQLTITGGKGDDKITLTNGTRTGNLIVYAKGDGDDVIVNFTEKDALKIGGYNADKEYAGGSTITVAAGTANEGIIELNGYTGNSITINGKSYSTSEDDYVSSNVLLADNNYSMNAANLSSLVQADISSYTPYDFDGGFGLTKEDKLTPQISYSGNDK